MTLPVAHVGVTPETAGPVRHPDTAAVPGSIRDRRTARSSGNHARSGVVCAHALNDADVIRSQKQGVSCVQGESDRASGNRTHRETPGPLSEHRTSDPLLTGQLGSIRDRFRKGGPVAWDTGGVA
jgi:hypothetical protein